MRLAVQFDLLVTPVRVGVPDNVAQRFIDGKRDASALLVLNAPDRGSSETVLRTTDRRRGSLAILIRNFSGPLACGVVRRSGSVPWSRIIAVRLPA